MSNLIRVGAQLHPITNTFIIRERPNLSAPAILECYNTMPPIRPLNTSHMAFSSNFGVVTESFTFACNNITDAHCIWTGQLSHEYGGNWAIEYDLLVLGAMPGGIWHGPRSIVRIDQFTGGNNTKRTLSYHSPSRGTGEYVPGHNWTRNSAGTEEAGLSGWGWPRGEDGKDVVFWLFDYSFDSPVTAGSLTLTPRGSSWVPWEQRLTSGNFQTFVQNSPWDLHLAHIWQVSDDLFLPGQSGTRLISRRYWDAPWERYPHLM